MRYWIPGQKTLCLPERVSHLPSLFVSELVAKINVHIIMQILQVQQALDLHYLLTMALIRS